MSLNTSRGLTNCPVGFLLVCILRYWTKSPWHALMQMLHSLHPVYLLHSVEQPVSSRISADPRITFFEQKAPTNSCMLYNNRQTIINESFPLKKLQTKKPVSKSLPPHTRKQILSGKLGLSPNKCKKKVLENFWKSKKKIQDQTYSIFSDAQRYICLLENVVRSQTKGHSSVETQTK